MVREHSALTLTRRIIGVLKGQERITEVYTRVEKLRWLNRTPCLFADKKKREGKKNKTKNFIVGMGVMIISGPFLS